MLRVFGAVLVLTAACGGGEAQRDGGEPQPGARARAYELWRDLRPRYRAWSPARSAPAPAEEPHGAWIRVYYNDVAAAAAGGTGPWPDGTILVADDFAPDPAGPVRLEAVNVMQKRAGRWFWARFTPPNDRELRLTRLTDIPIAGGDQVRCAGCHRQLGRRDRVISEVR